MSSDPENCLICAWLLNLSDMELGGVSGCVIDEMKRRWPGSVQRLDESTDPAVLAVAEKVQGALPPEVAALCHAGRRTIQ